MTIKHLVLSGGGAGGFTLYGALKYLSQNSFFSYENEELFELVAEDLKISRESLNSILGRKSADDLLGDIFNNFCIGK